METSETSGGGGGGGGREEGKRRLQLLQNRAGSFAGHFHTGTKNAFNTFSYSTRSAVDPQFMHLPAPDFSTRLTCWFTPPTKKKNIFFLFFPSNFLFIYLFRITCYLLFVRGSINYLLGLAGRYPNKKRRRWGVFAVAGVDSRGFWVFFSLYLLLNLFSCPLEGKKRDFRS